MRGAWYVPGSDAEFEEEPEHKGGRAGGVCGAAGRVAGISVAVPLLARAVVC